MNERDKYSDYKYAGFWIRAWASIIDNILLMIIILPLLFWIYGIEEYIDFLDSEDWFAGPVDFFMQMIFPIFPIVLFWIYHQATPGKMAISAKIVGARTGRKPSTGQYIGRCLAYFPSTLFLFLGFLWIAFDERKQGWHDKLSGTVVIRKRYSDAVNFEN